MDRLAEALSELPVERQETFCELLTSGRNSKAGKEPRMKTSNKGLTPPTPTHPRPAGGGSKETPAQSPVTLDQVRDVVRMEIKAAMTRGILGGASGEHEGIADVPPEPQRTKGSKSRAHIVKRGKLSGTIDQALLDLFEAERKARGVSVSRMIDIAMWRAYNYPPLSFEQSESSEE